MKIKQAKINRLEKKLELMIFKIKFMPMNEARQTYVNQFYALSKQYENLTGKPYQVRNGWR